ncbi:concanavalin A-like lectin/glucanase domain-containing protein [Coniochaeta sp. 2T2.1]|nr:concanavalin A-like lectin/glucanase domain-containing protein [Coniochaeta sp. 2T2.1]
MTHIILTSLLLGLLASVSAAPLSTTRISLPAGFTRVLFQDDFSLLTPSSLPLPSKWAFDTGTSYPNGPSHWGTNEVQSYTSSPSNIAVTPQGTLQITPLLSPDGTTWTSARIETVPAHDFVCQSGQMLRMEASIRVGAGGQPDGDMARLLVSGRGTINGAATAWQTVHCGSVSGGPCHETDGISGTAALSKAEWHTVAAEIDRANEGGDWMGERISWFVDGVRTNSVSGADGGDEEVWSSLARTPRFLLLNVACGGSFPDAIAKTKTPTTQTAGGQGASMEMRYVAVFAT